jgi:large subunit ribosomal protein L25
MDPLKNRPIHFDLLALKEGEKLTLDVNVVLKGSAAGVKDGGILQQSIHKLQIECLPQNIPSHIELDITNLLIGDSIRVSDINLEGVTILHDDTASIVTVVPPQAEEAPAEAAAEEGAAEPEVIAKGKKEEEE